MVEKTGESDSRSIDFERISKKYQDGKNDGGSDATFETEVTHELTSHFEHLISTSSDGPALVIQQ